MLSRVTLPFFMFMRNEWEISIYCESLLANEYLETICIIIVCIIHIILVYIILDIFSCAYLSLVYNFGENLLHILCQIWILQLFYPSLCLVFYSLSRVFHRENILTFKFNLSFFFLDQDFHVISKVCSLRPRSQSFVVLGFIFKSITNFELHFCKVTRYGSKFFSLLFLQMTCI